MIPRVKVRTCLLLSALWAWPAIACSAQDGKDDEGTDSSDADGSESGGSSSDGGEESFVNACTDPAGDPNSTCPEAAACPAKRCDEEYVACLGKEYKRGIYDAPCKDYMACVSKCGTEDFCDRTCTGNCQISTDCATCIQTRVNPCANQECSDLAQDCSSGEGGRTCADLVRCCNGLSGFDKESCQSQHDSVVGSGDAVCDLVYENFVTQGLCQ
jgi:hypothetical protein